MIGPEADPSMMVVVSQSANPDFFTTHLDVFKAAEQPGLLGLWRDFVLRHVIFAESGPDPFRRIY